MAAPNKSIWNLLCIWISPTFQHQTNSWQWGTTILLIVLFYTISISKEWFQWVYHFSCSQRAESSANKNTRHYRRPHGHQESMLTLRKVLAVSRRHVGDGSIDIDLCWGFKITCNSGWTHLKESWNLFLFGVFCLRLFEGVCVNIQYPVNPWPKGSYMRLGDQHTGFMLWNFDCGDKQQIGSRNAMRT